jgi:hypothetical protein
LAAGQHDSLATATSLLYRFEGRSSLIPNASGNPLPKSLSLHLSQGAPRKRAGLAVNEN